MNNGGYSHSLTEHHRAITSNQQQHQHHHALDDCDSNTMDAVSITLPTFSSPTAVSSPSLSLEALDISCKNSDSGATSPDVTGKRSYEGEYRQTVSSCLSSPEPGIIGQNRHSAPGSVSPFGNALLTAPRSRLIPSPTVMSSSLTPSHIGTLTGPPPPPLGTPNNSSNDVNMVVTEITSNLRRLADMIEKNSYGGVANLPNSPAPTPSPSGPRPDYPTISPIQTLAPMINLDPIAIRNLEMLARLADQSSPLAASTNNTVTGTPSVNAAPSSLIHSPTPAIDHRVAVSQVSPTPPNSSNNTPTPPTGFTRTGKVNIMQIRCKFGQLGANKGQFSSPHGFCLGLDEEIVIADTNNHRICIYDKSGELKSTFGIPGKDEGQLWYPRKVAFIRHSATSTSNVVASPRYVICDRGSERSRMQIFTRTGHFIRKIAIRYIDIVAGLAITPAGHIVAVDSVSPTVFVIAEAGDLLRWFDCSDHMREPSDVAVANNEYYICDFKGHCVVVFSEEGQFLRRIGYENLTSFPNGIDVSDAGDILIGDSHGNRFHVVVFDKSGTLLGEFECPYVKVSRCCGLKITSEGYVVTLAKNNHHVLILNTLYII